ncbi:MAG TPA: TonB-dependent receptor [Bryobacteraceae bacterium]|nr:TonB-dependent receptor [Bryobacteraceae bacterium]
MRNCLLVLAVTGCAFAQTWRGSITGVINDASGARVPAVEITLTQEETNRKRVHRAGPQGEYTFSALPPGAYRLEISKENFGPQTQQFTLNVNEAARADFTLQAGARTESTEVNAVADDLRTDTVAMGAVIDNRTVRALPLDGRNFYELTLLAPGTAPAAQGSAGSVRGDFAIHVNGAREDANNFILDGVYNGDPKLNGAGITPPVDAIREFEVLTHTYDASFGRNAGGQINVVLNSGANEFHGTVWEFFRNAELDERNHFAPAGETPRFQQNQFGFAIGGPIVKNRTFFFGDYEGRIRREGITRISNVPTALERTGDFSQSAMPPIDLFTQQPFQGNRIPAQRIHPVGGAIANLYPLPNRDIAGQNFISSPILRDRTHHFDTRLDHRFSDSSDFALRYSCADRLLFEPFAGASFARVPGFGNDLERRAQNVMASETHAFTPAFLNEVRLGFNRIAAGVFQENQDRNLNREVGLPSVWLNNRSQGLAYITLPGYSPLGDEFNNPQHSVTNTYQLIDQATYSAGRHFFKFGGEVRVLQQNAYRDIQSRGLLNFFGISGNPLGDLLQGFPVVTGAARVDNHQSLRSESYGLFVHDTWRIAPSFTLSAGVRYEYTSPGVDKRDRANLYDVATGNLAPVGQGNLPRAGYHPDRNNIAPRLGIAWTPMAGTVIRAAYGIYYDQSALAPSEGLYFSAPYYDFRLFYALQQFPLTLSDPFPSNYPFPVPGSALAFQRDLRTPYLQQWNFNIQRELGSGRVVELTYAGTKGTKLIAARDMNQPQPTPAPGFMRPNPRFDDIAVLESRASSIYHSMQARFQQRLAHGLTALASYTLGKSIDDASGFFSSATDPNFPQDSYNLRAERGRSNFDIRHRLSLSYTYDLPLRGNWLLRGWQTNGVWSFQTGRPFTVALHPDLDNSNTGRTVLGFGANDRPNVLKPAALDNPTEQRWFDTTAFVTPARGTFGNAGRNILEGPGLAVVNASLIKSTQVTERLNVQFRVEAFNLLNRVNYDQPDNFVGNPTFGSILSAGSPRRLQLGLKLLF